ncbi:MAG TPA: hypothetical protein VMI06_15700 [Terriglobia bacterium]|nr:hypothetical protein [Terriglobia bacterium]
MDTPAATRSTQPAPIRWTCFETATARGGLAGLGAVNELRDLVASTVVEVLWTAISPVVALDYAAVVMGWR